MKQNINQLKKEIVELKLKNRSGIFTERIRIKQAKIQTLQKVCEEIKKFKGEEYTDFEIWTEIREIFLKKFQGEEE